LRQVIHFAGVRPFGEAQAIRKGKTELEENGKSFSGKEKDWLGGLDSNQDSQIQSLTEIL